MPHSQLERLAELLLRGGISPRYVDRYIAELSDHFDDLVRSARERGLPPSEARQLALARIGTPDALAGAMLARADLMSFEARYPALTFGLGPLVLLAAAAAVGIFLLMGVVISLKPAAPTVFEAPEWLRTLATAWLAFLQYVMPVLVCAAVAGYGLRRRAALPWIVMGVVIAGYVGGAFDVALIWPTMGRPGELEVGASFVAPYPDVRGSMLRALINIGLVAIPTVWLHRILRARAAA